MSSQARESGFNPSSPHSSSAKADSYKHEGTPDTRLTAFSPDDSSVRSNKLYSSLALSASDPQPLRFPGKPSNVFRPSLGLQNADKDPFVATSSSNKPDQRLSPTASAFQPFTLSLPVQGPEEGLAYGPSSLGGSYHSATLGIANGFSNGVGLSRYLALSSSTQVLTPQDADNLFAHLERHGMPLKGNHYITAYNSKLYLRFTNVLDSWTVYHNAAQGGTGWHANLVRPDVWQLINHSHDGDLETEGQVILLVIIGPDCTKNATEVEATVYRMLNQQATIFAFMKQASSTDESIKILIEFCDADAATLIINKFHNFAIDGISLYLSLNKPGGAISPGARMGEGLPSHASRPSGADLSSVFQDMALAQPSHPAGALGVPSGPNTGHLGMGLPPVRMYPQMLYHNQVAVPPQYMMDQFPSRGPTPFQFGGPMQTYAPTYALTSPSSATALVPYQSDYVPRALAYRSPPDARRQNAMRINRSPYYNAAGHHNHVDINRIRDGVDVRSTIMLRNIPNKVDQAMLKSIIDQSSWGKYDFMYLRIDFANDCNVGYAFINFVDPLDIIDFVRERGNQRWNCFKSDKVAEISYATIQGKDCLVSKFRNSSVMLEPPHYRPKLYYTSNGPHPELASQEEPFPGPDNQSKMKRSCENAEHVGLFTPNAGAHIRDEQRRRRSQFDRGTRHAALEEYEHYRYFAGQ